MKHIAILAAIVCVIAAACKKDNKEDQRIVCIEPVQDCTCSPALRQYVFKADTIYALVYQSGLCNYVPRYWNSQYVEVNLPADVTADKFFSEAQFLKTIWSCPVDSSGSGKN